MGAVTYPDPTVAGIINDHFVPVRLEITQEPKLADHFQVIWTPNLNIVDNRERVVYHAEGWISPHEFAAMLFVGHGHYALKQKDFEVAVSNFKTVFGRYPQSEFAPEALYYMAVGKYLASHDADLLLQGWQDLQRRYPMSNWAMRSLVA